MRANQRIPAHDLIRRHVRRDAADRYVDLARHLRPPDRMLVHQLFRDGHTLRDLARLTGRSPRSLDRRVQQLLKRMDQPTFRFLDAMPHLLPREARAVARAVFLRGHSLRDAARATGLSLHRVRRHVQTTRDLARLFGQNADTPTRHPANAEHAALRATR